MAIIIYSCHGVQYSNKFSDSNSKKVNFDETIGVMKNVLSDYDSSIVVYNRNDKIGELSFIPVKSGFGDRNKLPPKYLKIIYRQIDRLDFFNLNDIDCKPNIYSPFFAEIYIKFGLKENKLLWFK